MKQLPFIPVKFSHPTIIPIRFYVSDFEEAINSCIRRYKELKLTGESSVECNGIEICTINLDNIK